LKLKARGIDALVCNWIKAWLTDRQQRVCLGGSYSGWRQVWNGVPQGSVLSPVLFLILINEHLYSPRMVGEIKEGKIGTANEQ